MQWGIGCLWLIISSFAILSASNYPQLLFYNSLIAIPPIILSIVTYFIINYQKRLPQINSLILAIGWCAYALLNSFVQYGLDLEAVLGTNLGGGIA